MPNSFIAPPERQVVEIDTDKASFVRLYDAFLGGKDNYAVDRALCRQVTELAAEAPAAIRQLHNWLLRALRFLARDVGLDQYLHLGIGLPHRENTHHIAQRLRPGTSVVYVDSDPMILAQARALLAENYGVYVAEGDIADPVGVLSDPSVTDHLDFTRPIGVILHSSMHYIPDAAGPHEAVARYVDALAPGSCIALSHLHDPGDGGTAEELATELERRLYLATEHGCRFRRREAIERFFDGLELFDPGVVPVRDWWPEGPRLEPLADADRIMVGGVARKP
ncbi:SAM-dependent methyltransferase [Amycolatopsis anabasis]|uniref:SAM-dependent methyltransferase n=1 Tax=Amycolatopsis anabasis TaxID=1840409 RepID=UPI00131E65A3|nr:SAM-dependent methyltransferase [Amycolatopsis anabasis]